MTHAHMPIVYHEYTAHGISLHSTYLSFMYYHWVYYAGTIQTNYE